MRAQRSVRDRPRPPPGRSPCSAPDRRRSAPMFAAPLTAVQRSAARRRPATRIAVPPSSASRRLHPSPHFHRCRPGTRVRSSYRNDCTEASPSRQPATGSEEFPEPAGISRTQPPKIRTERDKSGQIWTKPDTKDTKFPVQSSKSANPAQIPPKTPLSPSPAASPILPPTQH